MAVIPIDRVVDVNLTRLDNFATTRGFGVPLLIHDDATGPLNATTRTKVYGSLDEVTVDYAAGTEPHNMATAAFSQEVAPNQIKLGWRDTTAVAGPAFTAELDAINDFDTNWYWALFDNGVRGVAAMEDAAIVWTQARRKQAGFDTNEAGALVQADTTNIGARNKNQNYDRSWGFYHDDPTVYGATALASRLASFDFDTPNNAYTAKFKELTGVAPVNIGSAAVQAITGFVPQLGNDEVEGHLLNTYVDIGGINMVVEGANFANAFIDEVHASDWIVSRTEEEILAILANNNRIPMTNRGVGMLVHGVKTVLNRAFVAGLIADYEDDDGNFFPAYDIKVARVEDIPAAQRRNRIAPTIQACFRYAGAIHFTRVDYTMKF